MSHRLLAKASAKHLQGEVRKERAAIDEASDARAQTPQAAYVPFGQESHEPQAGDRDRSQRSAQRRRESAAQARRIAQAQGRREALAQIVVTPCNSSGSIVVLSELRPDLGYNDGSTRGAT